MGRPFQFLKPVCLLCPKSTACFSGATSFKEKPYFIFTAAVEDTPNAYDDLDILDSFIGVIKIMNGEIAEDFLI